MPEIAYLNHEFMPLDQAFVSVNDRGYLFADGVYEVIVTTGGKLFLLDEHLDRLEYSAVAINLKLPRNRLELVELFRRGLQLAGHDDSMIYLQVTRGTAPRRHDYAADLPANLFMSFRRRPQYSSELREKGVSLLKVEDIRWQRCDIKSIALLPNTMMKQLAIEKGFQEALFVSKEGLIREATSANLFLVRQGELLTPPADHHILGGITRNFILREAAARGIRVCERECTFAETLAADEVFITSSTINLFPVKRIDDHLIADGRPGPLSRTIATFFQPGSPSQKA
ncbi:MAG: aminotransferase class IV [Deltaproteobacteria bacterium]|nr:aminotransferase class IV [Deltaproteobacteria bacterium]